MTGWRSTALVAVLALSLLGNALALGAALRLSQARAALMGDQATVTLPAAERRALVKALAAHRDALRPTLQTLQAARATAVEAMLARPFDKARTTVALDGLRSAVDGLMQAGQAVVVEDLARRAGP